MDPTSILWPISSGASCGENLETPRSRSNRIRVVLVDMPQMLREIISELVAHERDLQIVGEFDDEHAALKAIDRREVAVVITSLKQSGHPGAALMLRKRPQLRVLAVSADGRASSLFEYLPHERMLGQISPGTVIAAIRGEVSASPVLTNGS
jgi:DNA-binding NarL/FixJ family response regulator